MSRKLVQVVANSTSTTFLHFVGSELIQKYLGDGPKLVRELFRVADQLLLQLFSLMKLMQLEQKGICLYYLHLN